MLFGKGEMVGSTAAAVVTDHLQSIRDVTNTSGVAVARYSYDPFGRQSLDSGTSVVTSMYAGQASHEPSALMFATHRTYDPALARWLGEDLIGVADDVNMFGYVRNNPLNSVDPLGLAGMSAGDVAGVIPGPCEYLAVRDLYRFYHSMRAANTIGADKFFHCMGSCRAAERGYCGRYVSYVVTEIREYFDYYVKGDSQAECDSDRDANRTGRTRVISTCQIQCMKYRPPYLGDEWYGAGPTLMSR